ncbi:Nudix family hydrolase [Basilea psittacipulmonis]|uniref:8-oxo-dGTP diphosphatase n=1 Tax=Basilea psittacipulmonis DSM 24701 TaxID=1072685 RepID=A0A077DGL3_9BURK|nr:Nudix family hydrolase [Basilea psittacipulmonis]AIL32263.1 hypothetical protein IX83_02085 [Basilea psittacipulmonis DSM 24701]
MQKPHLNVAVGIIYSKDQSKVLMAQRPKGKSWEDWWEFPGGKIEAGETVSKALARELKEELNIDVTQSYPWLVMNFEYPTHTVELHFEQVLAWQGEIKGLENQLFQWIDPHQHNLTQILPASEPILRCLQLPRQYAITDIQSFDQLDNQLKKLESLFQQGIGMVQFREPKWKDSKQQLEQAFSKVQAFCHQHQKLLLVNSCHPKSWWQQADGVQLRACDAIFLEERPLNKDYWVGVSAHHLADLLYAQKIEADFAVLGHILDTPSHAHEPALGWEALHTFSQEVSLPIYAIGGMSFKLLETALSHGAYGIAGIRFNDFVC